MRTLAPLGLLLAAAVAAPASASAAPVRLADRGLVDVSSDGRFVLLDDGQVVDRRGDAGLPGSTATPLALADRAAVVLERTPGGQLQVRGAGGEPQLVNLGPDNLAVPAGPAKLVRNGQAVIFQTTQSPVRIIERDLETSTSTVRAEGRSLLDASEDGRIITWIRQVTAAVPPPGRVVAPGAPAGVTANGTAVGYIVDDQAPRTVGVSSWTQSPTPDQLQATCPATTRIRRNDPVDLRVTQRGSVNDGDYALVLTETNTPPTPPSVPGETTSTTTRRLTTTGALASLLPDRVEVVRLDPVSSAYSLFADYPDGFAVPDRTTLSAPVLKSAVVPVDPAAGPGGRVVLAIPYAGGAGAAYLVASDTGRSTWVADDLITPDPEQPSTWQPLPRVSDPVDTASQTVEASWWLCDQLQPGPPSAYVNLEFPRPISRSLGTVTTTLTPAGAAPARRVVFSVRFGSGGPIIWQRTLSANTSFRLPGNPLGLTNLIWEASITFPSGERILGRGRLPGR